MRVPALVAAQRWSKRLRRQDSLIVQMCNLIPVAKTVGATGSFQQYPSVSAGRPGTPKEEQWKLRYHRTRWHLKSLASDISEQTVFPSDPIMDERGIL